MSWCYMAAVDENGEWSVHEVYRDFLGKVGEVAWTEHAVSAYGDTREELIKDLKMMLADVESGPVLNLVTEKVVWDLPGEEDSGIVAP